MLFSDGFLSPQRLALHGTLAIAVTHALIYPLPPSGSPSPSPLPSSVHLQQCCLVPVFPHLQPVSVLSHTPELASRRLFTFTTTAMKFTSSFAALFVLLPVLAQASPVNNGFGTGRGGQQGGQGANKGGNNAASAAPPAASSTTSSTNGDPQKSLTLVQSVIATGFENNGQDQPTAGQVPSLTSSNNFINFCATVPNLPITNGKQIQTGSCNPAPMGVIAAKSNMPASKFVSPTNFATIKANTDFTIKMAINHLETGHFTNAQENYFAAPQVVNAQGDIQGHSHVVIDKLTSLDQTTPTDPENDFVFFKGLNDAAVNGVLSVTVTGGLPAGSYRLASINAAANHQPALVAVAQHGSLDDMVYFTITDDGAPAAPASSSAAAPAATASVGAIKGANTGKTPGNQGGFAQNNQGTAPAASKPSTGFGRGGFRNN